MNREKITISDDGVIAVPDNPDRVRMTIIEIAELLGIFYPTAKRHVRSIETAGIADGDYKMTCIASGVSVHPEYYGLDMITAVAYRAKSWQADIFRRWLMERATQPTNQSRQPITVFFPVRESTMLN
jgi:hypothetical protein